MYITIRARSFYILMYTYIHIYVHMMLVQLPTVVTK